jgi:hypothetical protein
MPPRRNPKRPRARRAASVLALAIAIVATTAALALAHRAGLHYFIDSTTVADNDQNGLNVFCPSGKVTGGGIYITGSGSPIEVASSSPLDNHDGWVGYGNNDGSGTTQTIYVYAICTQGHFSYPTHRVTVHDGNDNSKDAMCPHGSSVVGGGAYLYGSGVSVEIARSAPIDGGDPGSTPDDGWTATGYQGTGSKQDLYTYAICSKSGSYKYVSRSKKVPDGTEQGQDANCPNGTKPTGGGVNLTGNDSHGDVEVATSAPLDTHDGWTGYANNDTGKKQTMTTTAICRS